MANITIENATKLFGSKEATREREPEAALTRLSAMPVTKPDAERLASEGKWADAEYRNRTLTEWAAFARQKYGSSGNGSGILRNLPALAAAVVLVAIVVHIRKQNSAK